MDRADQATLGCQWLFYAYASFVILLLKSSLHCCKEPFCVKCAFDPLHTFCRPMKALDYQETYLKSVLEFIGLTDITVVRAEDVGRSPEAANAAMQLAQAQDVSAVQAA